jgi:hypothetical protein
MNKIKDQLREVAEKYSIQIIYVLGVGPILKSSHKSLTSGGHDQQILFALVAYGGRCCGKRK